jgi:hypothetical protein
MELRRPFWAAVGGTLLSVSSAWAEKSTDNKSIATDPTKAVSLANQRVAQNIATAIAAAVPERGYDLSIEYQAGAATLRGTVASPEQMVKVLEAAHATSGVEGIVNEVSVSPSGIMPAAYQIPFAQPEEVLPSPAPEGAQVLSPATPEFTFPEAAATQYDFPFMPPFAWPAYAPYPNYSAVQYPVRYPPTAWPNMGPFHPYPEPPLDWREVTLKHRRRWNLLSAPSEEPPRGWNRVSLQWDDGHWYLRFKPCYDGRRVVYKPQDSCASGCGHGEHGGSFGAAFSEGYSLRFNRVCRTHRHLH